MPTKRRRDDEHALTWRRIDIDPIEPDAISVIVPSSNVPDYPQGWGEHIGIPVPITARVAAGPESPWDLQLTLDLGEDRRSVVVRSITLTQSQAGPPIRSGDLRGLALSDITRAVMSRVARRVFSRSTDEGGLQVTGAIVFETDEQSGVVTAGMAPFQRPLSEAERRAAMPPAPAAQRRNAVPGGEKRDAWRRYQAHKTAGTKDPMQVVGTEMGWSRAKVGKVVAEAKRDGWT